SLAAPFFFAFLGDQTLKPVSPSSRATMVAATPSPITLTLVRHISSILSKTNSTPMASAGKPAAVMMMAIATSEADGTPATPTAVNRDMTATATWVPKLKSRPYAWIRNSAAAHSYKAVPSILIVAPIGSTKLVVRLETPTSFSTHSMFTGKVALDEAVEKAVNKAGDTALRYRQGFTFAMKRNNSGNVTRAWNISAASTVAANTASRSEEHTS